MFVSSRRQRVNEEKLLSPELIGKPGLETPSAENNFRSYAFFLVGGIVLYLLVVLPVNLLVDPHLTFPHLALSRLSEFRLTNSRIAKANQTSRGGIDIAVLGSSRSANALTNPPTRAEGYRFVNLALPNTSLLELRNVGTYLFLHNQPSELIVGIEFDFFNYEFIPDDFLKSRFNPTLRTSELILEEALGRYAFQKSIDVWRTARGGNDGDNARLSRLAKFEILLADAVRLARDIPPPPRYSPKRLALLRQTVDEARTHGAKVNVVMMPVHSSLLLTYELLGLWPSFDAWKRDVVLALNGTDAAIWDFNGTDPRQAEAIPVGDGDMKWFTDASHASRAYGDLILRALVTNDARNDEFGVRLDLNNLEARLHNVRSRLNRLMNDRPDLVDLATRVVRADSTRRALQVR